jgi:hypothetical protein
MRGAKKDFTAEYADKTLRMEKHKQKSFYHRGHRVSQSDTTEEDNR